jgi:hypothetical protein
MREETTLGPWWEEELKSQKKGPCYIYIYNITYYSQHGGVIPVE